MSSKRKIEGYNNAVLNGTRRDDESNGTGQGMFLAAFLGQLVVIEQWPSIY